MVPQVNTSRSLPNGMGNFHLQPAYTGIRNVIASVYKEGGARALYRGVGIYMYIYSFISTACLV